MKHLALKSSALALSWGLQPEVACICKAWSRFCQNHRAPSWHILPDHCYPRLAVLPSQSPACVGCRPAKAERAAKWVGTTATRSRTQPPLPLSQLHWRRATSEQRSDSQHALNAGFCGLGECSCSPKHPQSCQPRALLFFQSQPS